MIVLALDVGSTTIKAQHFDAGARPTGPVLRAPTPATADGHADVETFIAAVESVVDDAVAAAEDLDLRPEAVALTTAWHGLAGLDGVGAATTPLSTWMDVRAADEARWLRSHVDSALAVHDRTGAPLHPSLPPARILWHRHHDDAGAFERTRRWVSIGELLEARWFGLATPASASMVSATGMWDQRTHGWDRELLDLLGLDPDTLAAVNDEWRGPLGSEAARRWPSLAHIPWLPALGDGAASLLGTGAGHGEGRRAALSIGTSAAVRVLLPAARRFATPLASALFAYLLDEDHSVVGAARSNAGNLEAWARRVLRVGPEPVATNAIDDDLVAAATSERKPGTSGVEADVALAGERSPRWPVEARGALTGLRETTTALDVVQALLESAVIGLASGLEALESSVGPVDVFASGGALRRPGWRHLIADGLGRPVEVLEIEEVTARGAAVAALERLGAPGERAIPPSRRVEPDPDRAAAFAELRRRAAERAD